ncbi:uracil phosphoribosyltransferase [Malacoplasma penetrans]|uniref:Uracil phosphoribosyltransferase n=1 Tax=Malacoplasma penetrans (strain HF-2) TaxID=272633 RepID=UPP_MALP2|nr:uracil phosphoribosyltransferase [Malacoplasma penetrans]Q8EUA1.1 RecName: Full=Uracil phosphoribosyltransferase; AltName: Full=UMP pyrophosphorylase; AltName: Full=UPRTase [Malacoplasma penetrans HF-2]RXY96868.1 uracil phosphoribosyltransferase [Malacoplasma penetrans]BAC44815.1 uracil phosphoribosyltransferase [Malacoplasma penetrans HF-2]
MTFVFDHPLIKDKLTRMRKIQTESTKFRDNLKEITQLMAYEVTKDLELDRIEIETPITKMLGYKLKEKIVLIPILRAGLGMVDGLKELIPTASIGHIGIYRDEETAQPKEYYCKMPANLTNGNAIILDPMLATGGSASKAIEIIKTYRPKTISFICLVAAPEGLKEIEKNHPDINIYVAALDEKLNEKYYIVPGLGDAGDRIFGTK